MEGWISLHRKILDNPIVCKDAEYFTVWCYLLLNATHKKYDAMFKGERITLLPGQFLAGRKSIGEKFNINESKVQRILKNLEIEQQIEQQTSNQNRLITIVNWELYQHSEQQNEQQVNNNRTTSEQQVNTNNNINNTNNEILNTQVVASKKKEKKIKQYDNDSFEMKVVDKLISHVKNLNPYFKEPNRNIWADEIRLMKSSDKINEEDILSVLDFTIKDSFWKDKVLSTKYFRDKYGKLYVKSKQNQPTYYNPKERTGPIGVKVDPYEEIITREDF